MSCTDHPDFPVGTLVQLDPQTKQTGDSFTLHSNEEVYIGRDKKRWYTIILVQVC